MGRRSLRAAAVLAAVAVGSACTSSSTTATPATRSTTPTAPTAESPASESPPSSNAPSTGITKVLLVVEENHGPAAALRDMPFLRSLGARYGRADDYRALSHPSLPNYLALVGGSTFGIHDDRSPSSHQLQTPSVFDVALSHGHTAAAFAEAMPGPCATSSQGRYAARHNPWTYFAGSQDACASHDRPAGSLTRGAFHDAVAAGQLPDVGMLTPDLCHDGHNCSLGVADHWLRQRLGLVMAGPDWRSGHLAVVVTFDEDEGHGDRGSTVLTVVAAPQLHGQVVTARLSHLSVTRWLTDLAAAPALSDASGAESLGRAFGL